ncbi:MAG: response regulator [Candidatus Margulisiibacteriota bacterium]|jgi:CheY-like chemotaxis protein
MEKPLILTIDDEQRIADNIAELIKRTDRYDAVAVYSAKDGFDFLAKNKKFLGLGGNKVKCILLDIKMPEMDGLQFLTKLRKEYGDSIGVVMLTAWEDNEKWDKATSGFVVSYLKKPFKAEELVSTLDRYFDGEATRMTLETFEKHIQKREEFKEAEKSL